MTRESNLADFKPYAQLLESNKRINLSGTKYFGRVKTLIYTIFIVLLLTTVALFLYDVFNLITSAIVGFTLFAVLLILTNFMRRFRSASVIGDSLILKNAQRKPYLTTLNTVKKARTYNILSVQCTLLDYDLDGYRHKTILIGKPRGISIALDNFFIQAKYWSKDKNKRQTISRVL
jgi:hypothetical protein